MATPLDDPGDENWAEGFQALGVDKWVDALAVEVDGNLYAGG